MQPCDPIRPNIHSINEADILAYAIFGLGYLPKDRLIIVAATEGVDVGRGHVELGGVVSCPLPAPRADSPLDVRGLDDVTRALAASGATMAFLVLVGTHLNPQSVSGEARRISEPVVHVLAAGGIAVIDVLTLGPTHYRSLNCAGASCCPPEGKAVAGLFSSRIAASMVLTGRGVVASEAELIADVAGRRDDQVAQRLAQARAAGFTPSRRRRAVLAWLRLVLGHARQLADSCGPDGPTVSLPHLSPAAAARWIQALEDDRFRDGALSLMIVSDIERAEILLTDLAQGKVSAAAEVLDSPGPQAPLAQASTALLADLARRAPSGHRAPALTVLSWRAWWEGDGVRSRLLCEAALQDRPDYRMAQLLTSMLTKGLPPAWVSRRAS